jgi:TP901 family phage tail tape measure protein
MAESNLKINITGDSSKLKNALSSANSQMNAFGKKMQSVGRSMSTQLTLPIVAAGAAATKLALDFDKSMTQIESLVGVAADEVAKMGEAAKTMATETGKGANEAGEALFFITSAGLRGSEAMDVLNASLKASAVGLGETKTIADLATSAMNAYGVENLSATAATDVLTSAVRLGKLEASELAGAMGGVIPIASNMGVGFDQVGAALAAMSKTGTNAANGATQLNAILTTIAKPTADAEAAFNKMGFTSDSLKETLAEKGLMGTLSMLKQGLDATGQEFTDIAPNVRAWKGVLDLTGSSMNDNIALFDEMTRATGATDEAFQKTSKSASFQFTKGMATMKNSLMEIGQIILPAVVKGVTKLSNFIKGLSDSFKNLSPQTQKIILSLTGILAAAGPMLIIFGKIMTGLSALGPILTMAATGFRVLTIAMAANPIIAIAGAIALVVTALNSYTKAQKEATAASVAELDTKAIDDRLKAAEEELAYLDTIEGKRRYSISAQKAMNKRLTNEIALLKERKSVLKEQAELESKDVETATTDAGVGTEPIKVDITPVVNPEDAKAAADKLKQLQSQINDALVTNDAEAYQKRRADAEAHYNELINNEKTTADQSIALENAKQAKLAEIDNTETERLKQKGVDKLNEERTQQQQLLDLKQQIANATNASEEEQKALEIERIRAKYEELRLLAAEHQILTAEQQAAFDEAQAEAEAAVYEQKKANFLGFTMDMQTAMELANKISGQVQASFGVLGGVITNAFGGASSAMGAFVGTLAKDALDIVGHNLKVAMSNGITGATETAKSFGPAAAFVLPALIAGATALISGSFSKFADGGIVSGPTMGLVGEYPGARSNPEVIAPLNKLQGMIGGVGGGGNVNVTGSVRVDGQDLLIAIERANETAGRIY